MDLNNSRPILKSKSLELDVKYKKRVSFRDNTNSETSSIADVHEVESYKQYNVEEKQEGTCLTCIVF
ncbi:unnamed protein product [Blepharisma stoltei]|uniref:Uncharacterized protein n=1 Tax=Blepharisma stoltei TaxID=1481888 RepID=A0AAU9JJF8_9CILI|nr:unnamed protein product [Blepharisma stoltei]